MASIKYDVGTLSTLIDQTGAAPNTLASLAASAGAITANPVDNTPATRGDFWADFELNITYAVAPTANKTIDFYLMESADGTNYADGSGGASPVTTAAHFIGSVPVRAVATGQRITLRGVPLPPTKFNIMVVNSGDQALATSATAQTLKILPYREQY
jgi:hypothetical protein